MTVCSSNQSFSIKKLRHKILIILFCFGATSSFVEAETWGAKSWYGGSGPGMCLIATDSPDGQSISFGYYNGKTSLSNKASNLSLQVIIRNVLGSTARHKELFPVLLAFNDESPVESVVRAAPTLGDVQLYFIAVNRNRITEKFEPKALEYEYLLSQFKRSNSLTLRNINGHLITRFSLMGFTKIFNKFEKCVENLK